MEKLDSVVNTIDKLMSDLPPQDFTIMSLGAFAGWHGYTPLTALINAGGSAVSGVDNLAQRASQGDIVAGFETGMLTGGVLGGSIGAMFAAFSGAYNGIVGNQDIKKEDKKTILDGLVAHMALACVGSIEAYAITRPGAIAGIGEIVKGIGEIIPG